ncbi:LysR family transcriptional regulator [Bordetella sp. BOR01]|uniref:LysR family transcriptional regulator n=1 Tax=Bordetella sp. BOR01 TaxID=2854779 RepID=UPI001C48A8F2|nr:LysR family transcriptional regulator [Bordetella sp. BOR01]MBV7483941.1 LysR family transcriptional regulator [Bordetella sp. BOR01]
MPVPSPPSAFDHDFSDIPDWNLLLTWVLIVQTGTLAQAARQLGISRAAVSQRLKQLETGLATELIIHGMRPAQPTMAGTELYEHAERLLRQASIMREAMRAFHAEKRRIVRFGTVESFAGTLGPCLLAGLGQSGLPEIRLSSGLTPDLERQLEKGQVDMTVTTSPAIGKGSLRKHALFSERYLLVLPRDARIDRTSTLDGLGRALPLIRYSARSVIGHDIDVYLNLLGVHIPRTSEFDTAGPILSLVSSGMGFAITTPLCLWEVRHFIPLVQIHSMSSLHSRKGQRLSPPERTFYLGYRDNEPPAIRRQAEGVIQRAAEQLMNDVIGPALAIESALLWQSHAGQARG